MCGIAGLVNLRGNQTIDARLLERMNNTLHHRGPTEGDTHVEPGVGLAHRRLSIIDLESGRQPLSNEDGTVIVVFNGEIYNFIELMAELKEAGHVFSTQCDTEVIVHAWEQWGEACVQKLRGMFSFVIWDRNKKTLFAARDRTGIKPFFYAILDDGTFAFGSELKALLCLPGFSRELDPFAVEDYFAYGYIPEPRSIFTQAKKLPPAHHLMIQPGQAEPLIKPYWDLSFDVNHGISEEEASHELIVRLRESVQSHLVSDVPLGAFLSGGVDSSAVVASMAELSAKPVMSCSIAFDDPEFDETIYAQQVAQRYKTDHCTKTVDADDYSLIDTLAQLYDEPYADSSAIPTYRVCELARQRVTVALSGDGGDELFAGYRRYRHTMAENEVRSMLPTAMRTPLFGLLAACYPKADWAPRMFRAKSTFESLARSLVDGYFQGVSIMPDRIRNQIFSSSFRHKLGGYSANEVMRGHAARACTDDPLSLIQYLDFKTYLPGDILTKVDRASMAHALEVRVPLLDHKFVEWACTLPTDLKLRKGTGKYIFKKSLEQKLSHDVLYRPKKGFSIPVAKWLRGPLRERTKQAIHGPLLAETGIFNMPFLQKMVEQHLSEKWDHSASIWTILMFEAFLRNTLGIPTPALQGDTALVE